MNQFSVMPPPSPQAIKRTQDQLKVLGIVYCSLIPS